MGIANIVLLSMLGITMAVCFYYVFISDWIVDKLVQTRGKKSKKINANKMAQIKMVSDDPKDIEKFVASNVEYLSDQMVQQFVERIKVLQAERAIEDDDVALKQRIATAVRAPKKDAIQEEIDEEGISNGKAARL